MLQKWLLSLRSCAIFRDISDSELQTMLECLKPLVSRYAAAETVALAGAPFTGLGIVLSGEVAVTKENAAGNRVIIAIFGPGELFGEIIAFAGDGRWPVTVVAQSDSEVMFLPPERIVGSCPRQCQSHHTLIMNMLRVFAGRALILNQKLEYLTMKSVRQKVSAYLWELHHKTGQTTFMLPLGRDDLADFLNLTRPSLSRELSRMRDDGVIDFHRASVKIKDLRRLQTEATGGGPAIKEERAQ
jgi:CRP-like cAMP-binding protein